MKITHYEWKGKITKYENPFIYNKRQFADGIFLCDTLMGMPIARAKLNEESKWELLTLPGHFLIEERRNK